MCMHSSPSSGLDSPNFRLRWEKSVGGEFASNRASHIFLFSLGSIFKCSEDGKMESKWNPAHPPQWNGPPFFHSGGRGRKWGSPSSCQPELDLTWISMSIWPKYSFLHFLTLCYPHLSGWIWVQIPFPFSHTFPLSLARGKP